MLRLSIETVDRWGVGVGEAGVGTQTEQPVLQLHHLGRVLAPHQTAPCRPGKAASLRGPTPASPRPSVGPAQSCHKIAPSFKAWGELQVSTCAEDLLPSITHHNRFKLLIIRMKKRTQGTTIWGFLNIFWVNKLTLWSYLFCTHEAIQNSEVESPKTRSEPQRNELGGSVFVRQLQVFDHVFLSLRQFYQSSRGERLGNRGGFFILIIIGWNIN